MRLLKTLLATALMLALTGTAFAKNTHDERTVPMGGTAHVQSGGTLRMQIGREPSGKVFHFVVQYTVAIKARTRLLFTAYPCKTENCAQAHTIAETKVLPVSHQHLTFHGNVGAITTADGRQCVFTQVRDLGPSGKKPGKIVPRGSHTGVRVCHG
jgi:hypothetical protein